jgi:hypothetical protein
MAIEVVIINKVNKINKSIFRVLVLHHVAEAVGFFWRKKPQHAFLRRGSKAVCPMSQICGMLKNPVIHVEVGITGQINRPFLARNSALR